MKIKKKWMRWDVKCEDCWKCYVEIIKEKEKRKLLFDEILMSYVKHINGGKLLIKFRVKWKSHISSRC